MARFVNNHQPEYKVVHPMLGVLAFHRGVLDTDEAGASFIKTLPLFGRHIFEGDETAPAHGVPVRPSLSVVPKTNPILEAQYCAICDKVFAGPKGYARHMRNVHGQEGGDTNEITQADA